jgi:predicted DNA binding protein
MTSGFLFFNCGIMDETRVYKKGLTDQEVKALYEAYK